MDNLDVTDRDSIIGGGVRIVAALSAGRSRERIGY